MTIKSKNIVKTKSFKFERFNIQLEYKNIKHMYLRVYAAGGNIKISAPEGVAMTVIKAFIMSKLTWIDARLLKLSHCKQIAEPKYIDGAYHEFGGRHYRLKVIKHQAAAKVVQQGDMLRLYVKPQLSATKYQAVLELWYRRQLNAIIPGFIRKYEPIMNVRVYEFRIKKMKTRWGSCNTKAKRIWLNLELAKKPRKCLEYVIVHEMVHLLEPSHGRRFYHLMDRYMPDWKHYKKQLNSAIYDAGR